MPGRRAPEAERREQILAAAYRVATKRRLEGLTVRAVAEAASLSPGLVLFHFESRDALIVALLDWLVAGTIVGTPAPEVLALPTARARLLGLLRQELVLIAERRPRLELFFDYWVAGIGHRRIRGRIRSALAGYRATVEPYAAAAVAESPAAFPAIDGADLAGLVVAMIEGCVMQAVVDPSGFRVDRVLAAVATVVGPDPGAKSAAARTKTRTATRTKTRTATRTAADGAAGAATPAGLSAARTPGPRRAPPSARRRATSASRRRS